MSKLLLIIVLVLLTVPVAFGAVDFNKPLTVDEEAQFDQILAPVMKIYSFIKYAATIAGVLMLVFSGITFVTAGGEQGKKEKAKNMAAGVKMSTELLSGLIMGSLILALAMGIPVAFSLIGVALIFAAIVLG
ncbi:MAG: hypothetical protein V1729_03475, partial [Candidatus Woesearchaeota archaeon]